MTNQILEFVMIVQSQEEIKDKRPIKERFMIVDQSQEIIDQSDIGY